MKFYAGSIDAKVVHLNLRQESAGEDAPTVPMLDLTIETEIPNASGLDRLPGGDALRHLLFGDLSGIVGKASSSLKLGAHLVCFAGSPIGSPESEAVWFEAIDVDLRLKSLEPGVGTPASLRWLLTWEATDAQVARLWESLGGPVYLLARERQPSLPLDKLRVESVTFAGSGRSKADPLGREGA